MNLELNFADLTNIKNPAKKSFEMPAIIDDATAYKFSPKRYSFYMKFIDGLSDPESLKKILYKNKEIKTEKLVEQEKILKIVNSLQKIYANTEDENVKDVNETIKKRITDILGNIKMENNKDLLENVFPKTTVGGNLEITSKYHPMRDFINKAKGILNIKDNNPNIVTEGENQFLAISNDIKEPPVNNVLSKEKLGELTALVNNIENNSYVPITKLNITMSDRLIFIGLTFILRLVSISIVEWCLNANIIKSFFNAFIYYCLIYIVLFIFIIMLVNVVYYYPVLKLFGDSTTAVTLPNLLYYFYIYTNGYMRLLTHIFIILILMFIPYIIKTDEIKEDINISYDYVKKKKIITTLSNFSLIIWILTSIIAIKF